MEIPNEKKAANIDLKKEDFCTLYFAREIWFFAVAERITSGFSICNSLFFPRKIILVLKDLPPQLFYHAFFGSAKKKKKREKNKPKRKICRENTLHN